ncbi:MAG: hypothetical protein K2X99_08990 [Gemmatimonadaceae bacterium]|nr:hypothetical protein [Gemmatimonadaceae bacterium]
MTVLPLTDPTTGVRVLDDTGREVGTILAPQEPTPVGAARGTVFLSRSAPTETGQASAA